METRGLRQARADDIRALFSIVSGGVSGGMPVLAGQALGLGQVDLVGILLTGPVLLRVPSPLLTGGALV